MWELILKLPQDIINYILPFTYKPQLDILLQDITTFVEYKIRSRKIQVYYCEEIKINHFGNDDTIWKILKIFYHQNLSFMQLESNRIANKKSLKIIFYDFKQCAKHLLKGIILIVKQREYYFPNFLIDLLKPLIRSYAFITLLRKNNFSL